MITHSTFKTILIGMLLAVANNRADTTLVAKNSTWKYLDNGSNQGTGWTAPDFIDTAWASGPGELGYGDSSEGRPEAWVVSYGSDANNKYITTYFRRTFSVVNPADFTSLRLGVVRDDGVAVYLNGAEIFRNNLPAGAAYNTVATIAISGTAEATYQSATGIPTSALVAGNNVLAVEIHQSGVTSSDISFDLELIGVSPGSAAVTRGPYLTLSTPSSMIVRWRTDLAIDSRVHFGTTLAGQTFSVSDATATTEHSVRLTGLSTTATF